MNAFPVPQPGAPAVSTSARAEPDADLLALGRVLRLAWTARDAFYALSPALRTREDEANRAAMGLENFVTGLIEGVPAHGLDGLRVKAMAAGACKGVPIAEAATIVVEELIDGDGATDRRLVAQIAGTLVQMGWPDPDAELIAACRRYTSQRELQEHDPVGLGQPLDLALDEAAAAWRRIGATPAHTAAGRAEKARLVQRWVLPDLPNGPNIAMVHQVVLEAVMAGGDA